LLTSRTIDENSLQLLTPDQPLASPTNRITQQRKTIGGPSADAKLVKRHSSTALVPVRKPDVGNIVVWRVVVFFFFFFPLPVYRYFIAEALGAGFRAATIH
jgi:hypothetical protein